MNRLRNTSSTFLSIAAVLLCLIATHAQAAAPTVPPIKSGQTKCYSAAGNEISCPGTGQDGELQPGTAWPTPRFLDNTDGTVTDNMTGLIWSKLMQTPGPAACPKSGSYVTWQEGLDHVICLNENHYLGYSDWRLPTAEELASVVNYSVGDQHTWFSTSGFTLPSMSKVRNYYYWSATSLVSATSSAFALNKPDGNIGTYAKGCSFWGTDSSGANSGTNNMTYCNYNASGKICGYQFYSNTLPTNCDYMLAWPVRGN